jgi:glycosyltransferase involved in cell wall biosynthesis
MAVRLLVSSKLRGGPVSVYVTHNGLFAVVLLLRGFRVLYDVHAAIATRPGRIVTRWIARHPRCVAISVVSDGMRRHLAEAGVDHPRTMLRRNGVSISSAAGSPSQHSKNPPLLRRFVVAYSGNLEPARGIDLLLQVAPLLADEVVFRIVGGSPAEVGQLRYKVQVAHLNERFELLGKVPHEQVAAHLRTADALIAIYTARVRNIDVMCPMKLLEYFALGLPIIAPDFPTVRELVVDEGNGLLYQPEDAAHLAAAIRRLQEDRSLRDKLAQEARTSAAALTWERNAETLVHGVNSALR